MQMETMQMKKQNLNAKKRVVEGILITKQAAHANEEEEKGGQGYDRQPTNEKGKRVVDGYLRNEQKKK
jgi:hypothetical protein